MLGGMDEPTDASPARLTALVSWLLAQSSAHAGRLVADGLAAVNARGYHYRVLATLEEYGPASQAGLGRRSGIHVSDMVATLNELAEQRLVERMPDPADRRRNIITLTAAGRDRLDWLDKQLGAIQEELLVPLSSGERAELKRLLGRMVDHHARKMRDG
jgi:DNA-binding MarR family transcriptional regulator